MPLGDSYLELITVVDAIKAAESAFGRWVTLRLSSTPRPLGWAVRTSRFDEGARRLDLPVHAGSRTTPGGDQLRWRSAGLDEAALEPSLPFFIDWAPKAPFPGRTDTRHRAGSARITRLALDGDPDRLALWLGDHQLPIVMRPGKPALNAINIATDEGEIILS